MDKKKILGRSEVRNLLHSDLIERRQKKFDLLSGNELKEYLGSEFMDYKTEFFTVTSRNISESDAPFGFYSDGLHQVQNFKILDDILKRHYGHLVMAGGQVHNILKNRKIVLSFDDIDLFFYNTTIQDAEMIIVDVIYFITNNLKNYNFDRNPCYNENVQYRIYVTRNEHVVNIILQGISDLNNPYGATFRKEESIYVYDVFNFQFILRIYPSIDLIIGGFDLTIAALAYDGYKFHATKLGAWSFKHNTNIVDISRASTSFEYRINKYTGWSKCINILLPGILNKDLVKSGKSSSKESFYKELDEFVQQKGFMRIDAACFEDMFIPSNKVNIFMLKQFKLILKDFVKLYPDYTPEKYPNATSLFFESCNVNKEDLLNEVRELVRKNNYFILPNESCYDDFSFNEKSGYYELYGNTRYNDLGLYQAPRIKDRKHMTLKDIKRYSDYAYKNIHINRIAYANASCMATNNLNAIKAYFIIDIPDNKCISKYTYDDIVRIWTENINNPFIGKTIECWNEAKNECVSLDSEMVLNVGCRTDETIDYQNRKHMKTFGEFGEEYLVTDKERRCEIETLINLRIKKNYELTVEKLSGLTWITKNPGRQWTSSFNPTIENPRIWYKQKYTPFIIGIPCLAESTLRLMWKGKCPNWKKLPKDIFNMLLFYIAKAYWQ